MPPLPQKKERNDAQNIQRKHSKDSFKVKNIQIKALSTLNCPELYI